MCQVEAIDVGQNAEGQVETGEPPAWSPDGSLLAYEEENSSHEHHVFVSPSDGSFPQVGDNDDGRLAGLDDEPPGSHRRHLAVGGAMLNRPDLLGAAHNALETAVWLYGTQVLTPSAPPRLTSKAFPEGGFLLLRAEDVVMTVDVGELGLNGIGGFDCNYMRFRHMKNTTANFLYVDGHVGSKKLGEVLARDICLNP